MKHVREPNPLQLIKSGRLFVVSHFDWLFFSFCLGVFDVLAYTDADVAVPFTWIDSDPKLIANPQMVKLHAFDTKVRRKEGRYLKPFYIHFEMSLSVSVFILCRFTKSTPSSRTRTMNGMKKKRNRSWDTRKPLCSSWVYLFESCHVLWMASESFIHTPVSFSVYFLSELYKNHLPVLCSVVCVQS